MTWKTKRLLSEISERLSYDPLTGDITYTKTYSRIKKGMKAGYIHTHNITGRKYKRIGIGSKRVSFHIVAWALYYGVWPKKDIDHINGDGADNRIENLRCVGQEGNMKNKKTYRNNKLGQMGVYNIKEKYAVTITSNNERKSLGIFNSYEDAVTARKNAEAKLGFHENHGRKQ